VTGSVNPNDVNRSKLSLLNSISFFCPRPIMNAQNPTVDGYTRKCQVFCQPLTTNTKLSQNRWVGRRHGTVLF